ncbi:hypothetical protein Tco_0823960 [Tanacetum coccineum]|uniref:Reverse transcriptase Ty1/copia-type domain-containing protein n=1 Tax=Tanacetum coccineum TaxID=301880 RepID=A0ABQ5ANG9_9ASTR
MLTRAIAKELSAASAHECLFVDFLFEEEPKKVSEALKHPGWVDAMQDELNQFARNKVWTLVPAPYAQGYNHGNTINMIAYRYDETFAPVARLEAIKDLSCLFHLHEIAFTTYMSKVHSSMIKKSERGISINQEKYVNDLLKKYDINGSSVKTPMVPLNNLGPDLNGKAINETQYRGMIGSLMYLIASRPDIQFSTCLYTRYQENPKESHLIAVKRIFKYLKAMSSAEAEYVAAAGCCANILWMKSQLTKYDIIYQKVPIFCDNTSAIAISNNPVLHSRIKHIDIRYHFIRDHILKGNIELHFILPQYQLADIFTKPLDEPTFKRLIVELGYGEVIEAKGTVKKAFLPPRVDIDFAKLIWDDIISKLKKKNKEKVIPYPRFLSLLLELRMEGYGTDRVTIIPTQIFSVNNLILKKSQPEGPPFTAHMLSICNADAPVAFQAPKTSSHVEKKDSQGS